MTRTLLCCVSAFVLSTAALGVAAQRASRQVILISVDGMTPVEYLQPDAHGLKIPNLRALAAGGCKANGVEGVFPTSTYPSHTAMITGQVPARHGIVANTPMDPLGLEFGGWYYYADAIKVPTIWDAMRAAKVSTAAVSWPVTVGAPVDYLLPEYRPVRTAEDRSLMRVLATPGLFKEMEAEDPKDRPMTDEWRVKAVLALERTRRPQLLALHLSDLDEAQHKFGPHTPQTHAVLETIDGEIGQIREWVRQSGNEANTSWVVVSDHGFLTLDKLFHPLIALREAGLITTDKTGKITDWKVYLRNSTGSLFMETKDPNDHQSAATATAILQKLAADPANGIARIVLPQELQKMGADPGAFLAMEPVPGFGFGANLTGPAVTPSPGHGAHGYDASLPEARSSMILAGAGVAPCTALEGVRILDVGPTAAALLGVSMPSAAGKNVNPAAR